eukprot:8507-Eustigmatos_ZCMA.PRE.1
MLCGVQQARFTLACCFAVMGTIGSVDFAQASAFTIAPIPAGALTGSYVIPLEDEVCTHGRCDVL